ncbi:hypothetical protein T484DRAFT_1973206 [Baffinella frigidus]|nr:hypothetical protein T484DRAFT_1973206 [Cryptophyta sp. CCMP2293]
MMVRGPSRLTPLPKRITPTSSYRLENPPKHLRCASCPTRTVGEQRKHFVVLHPTRVATCAN